MKPKRRHENVAADKAYIDYKDLELLQKCLSMNGKLVNRRRLGTDAKTQHRVKQAVHRARYMALLPYGG